MRDLSDLRIYKLAIDLGEQVWSVVVRWDNFCKWSIGKQLVTSADSVGATMIEGYYRHSEAERARFFRYSLASAKEAHLWLWRARNRSLLDKENWIQLNDLLINLEPQVMSYINKLGNRE